LKREITVMQDFCDFCGDISNHWSVCMECSKNICYDCQKTHAKKYRHGVNISGSGDGLYCLDCDSKLDTPKLRAYRQIEALRQEADAFYEDFKNRSKIAEKILEGL